MVRYGKIRMMRDKTWQSTGKATIIDIKAKMTGR